MQTWGAPRRLTRRQAQIAALLAEGRSDQDVAHRLGLSPGTVGHHVERLLRKLGARDRRQLAERLARPAAGAVSRPRRTPPPAAPGRS